MMRTRSLFAVVLMTLVAAGFAVGGSLLLTGNAAAFPGMAEFSVISRAALADPLDIAVGTPSDVEMAQVTIEPGGTSGMRKYAGPALISVISGKASRYQVEGGSCRSTTVLPGVAYVVSPGDVDEIRNEGASSLDLQTTSLAPAGEPWATSAPAPAGCGAAKAKGLTATVLTRTFLAGPARIKTDSPSDVLVGRIIIPPGTSAGGWHSHPGGALVSVERGRFDVPAVAEGRCVRKQFPAGTGLVEPDGEVHDGRNDGTEQTTLYFLAISSSTGPFTVPQAPPSRCSTPNP